MPLFQTKTPTVFTAIPLAGCRSFTFNSMEQYAARYEKIRHACEEVEIDLYDEGFPGAAALWEAFSRRFGLADMHRWYEDVENLSADEHAALYHALAYKGIDDLDEALDWARDEGRPFEGTTKEFAENLAEDQGSDFFTGETAERYFDYEAFGRDLGFDLEEDDGLSDKDRGEAWVDDMGGVSALDAQTRERYFNWDSFARDLDLGGDVVEFQFAGKTWTIWAND